MESINEKIKRIRLEAGVNQADVARSAGIKQSSYASIEKGDTKAISIEVGKGIAKALRISFNELFDIEIESNNSLIEELKSENYNLKEQLNLIIQQSILKDKVITGYERDIESTKKYSLYWPQVFILNVIVELNSELQQKQITEDEFKKRLESFFSIAALAFLFSTEFDNDLIDELEKHLHGKNEANYKSYFKTFIEFVRKTQVYYETHKRKVKK